MNVGVFCATFSYLKANLYVRITLSFIIICRMKGGNSVKKRSCSLAVLLLFLFAIQAQAAVYANQSDPTLSFNGTTANCYGSVTTGSANSTIKATLTLWDGSKVVDSWSSSGTGSLYLSGSCTVSKGKKYTLTLDATVNGVSISRTSTSGTC